MEPEAGSRAAGPAEVWSWVDEARDPTVETPKVVLAKVKEASRDGAGRTSGIQVTGGASWLVATAANEANCEVALARSRGVAKSSAARE